MLSCFSEANRSSSVYVHYPDILKSALRSKLAYSSPEEVLQKWNQARDNNVDEKGSDPDPFLDLLKYVKEPPMFITSDEDAQAYIWYSGNTMYLTFRGTSSSKDLSADFTLMPHHIKNNIKVHQGFFDQFASVEEDISEQVNDFLQSSVDAEGDVQLVISGHSLGAALAQLATLYYGMIYPCVSIVCHTFGSPRVGNQAFVDVFERCCSENVRVVNFNDPVPMIPMAGIWKHSMRRCIVIDDNCKIQKREKDTPWYSRFCKAIGEIDFSNPIQDHECNEYIRRLTILASA